MLRHLWREGDYGERVGLAGDAQCSGRHVKALSAAGRLKTGHFYPKSKLLLASEMRFTLDEVNWCVSAQRVLPKQL